MDPQVNKFVQVSSDGHQMSLAGGPMSGGARTGGSSVSGEGLGGNPMSGGEAGVRGPVQ